LNRQQSSKDGQASFCWLQKEVKLQDFPFKYFSHKFLKKKKNPPLPFRHFSAHERLRPQFLGRAFCSPKINWYGQST
jgi:hypothetical protein